MTSPVSAIAYRSIPDLEERQRRVYECIASHPDVSSNDVSRILHMRIENVRSRVGELLRTGEIAVSGEKMDRITGRTVRAYRVVEASLDGSDDKEEAR